MTMTPDEAIERVNSDWVYRPDGFIDKWNFNTPGDCEGYSLRVLMFIYGSKGRARRALLTGKANMWFCRTLSGNGHAVLEYQGMFADNRVRKWCKSMDDMYLQQKRRRYSKIELLIKLGVGRL